MMGKTEVMIVGSDHNLSKLPNLFLTIGQSTINISKKVNNIGAIFDNNCSMLAQVNNMCKSAWFHLKRIGKIRPYLTKQSAEKLIHAFVTSKLDNLNCLLSGVPQGHLDKLRRVQYAAARIITRTKIQEHMKPILFTLHWLPIEQRIQYKILLITYKALNDQGPQYIKDLLKYKTPKADRSSRSVSNEELDIPSTKRVTFGDRAFRVIAPKMWNDMSTNNAKYYIPFLL